ncbi:MAG: flagellar basal body rod protein FlgB [Deltaproteobacteria bacterium]|nr:flagellar basal body rod protein FlgB [Deltaproteobacteria bacterium]
MKSQGLFEGTFPLLEKAMDLRALKHNVTVSNIANKDTPDYKAFDLVVEEELEKIMGSGKDLGLQRTRRGHFPGKAMGGSGSTVRPKIDNALQFSTKRDGNTVNIDKEMAKLSENNLMYNALTQIISKKFRGLKDVIQGGK